MLKKPKAFLHDALFKDAYSNVRYSLDIFRLVFTKAEFALFDWTTLVIEASTLITKQMKERRTDIIFSVQLKGSRRTVRILLLLEHKSYQSQELMQQLLEYQFEAYRKWKYEYPVIPILVYHGKDKKWRGALSFHDCLGNFPPKVRQKLGRNVLNFTCKFLNLSDISERKLSGLTTAPLLYILAHIWKLDERKIEKMFVMGQKLSMKDRRTLVSKAVDYIHQYDKRFSWEILQEIEEKITKEDLIMPHFKTSAEIAKEEGLEKGLKRGRQETIKSVAKKMLQCGLDVKTIVETTGLSLQELEKMKKA